MDIRKIESELDTLMLWRMEVLREVFTDSENVDWQALEVANRSYYRREIPNGGHIACMAEPQIGCGGLCLYDEMPSPDNPTGRCAYLMNIYVRPEYRGEGYGKDIVTWLIREAQILGITKIYLESSACAKPMYSQLGFMDMKDYMKLKK